MYASYSKLSKELKNSDKIEVGQALFKQCIKYFQIQIILNGDF